MCVLFVKWHQPFFLVCSFCNCLDVFFLYFIIFCTFLGISCSSFFGAKLAGLFLYNKELMTALSRKFAFCLFFCIKNIFTYFLCPLGSLEYSASTFFSFLFFLLFCNLPSFPISVLRWVKKIPRCNVYMEHPKYWWRTSHFRFPIRRQQTSSYWFLTYLVIIMVCWFVIEFQLIFLYFTN